MEKFTNVFPTPEDENFAELATHANQARAAIFKYCMEADFPEGDEWAALVENFLGDTMRELEAMAGAEMLYRPGMLERARAYAAAHPSGVAPEDLGFDEGQPS